MRTRWLAVCVAAWAVMAVSVRPALAHAILVESTPSIEAKLDSGDIAIRLRFNSRVDRGRSRLTLMRADRKAEVLPISPAGSDDLLLAEAHLPAGIYTLRWQVLAIDGHITRGDVPFEIKAK
jgi:methionine-rich copper-binding protein CopC